MLKGSTLPAHVRYHLSLAGSYCLYCLYAYLDRTEFSLLWSVRVPFKFARPRSPTQYPDCLGFPLDGLSVQQALLWPLLFPYPVSFPSFSLFEQKGFTRTRPCRDKPRLAKRNALGQDTGRAQGNLTVDPLGTPVRTMGGVPGSRHRGMIETDRTTTFEGQGGAQGTS
jgi:hypothetical protein